MPEVKKKIRRLVSCVLILCVTLCGCMSKKVDSTEKKNGGYTQTTEKQGSKKETTQSNEKTKETDIGKKLQECIAEKDYLSNYVVTSDALYFAVGQEKSSKTRLYKADIDSRKIFPSKVDFCDPQYFGNKFQKILKMYFVGPYLMVYCNVDDKLSCMVLDQKLNCVDCISLGAMAVLGESVTACVLPQKKKIVYYTDCLSEKASDGGFYETDYRGKTKKVLFKCDSLLNNQYKFNSASDMVLADNENQIYFTGQYYEKGQDEGTQCYGIYDIRKKNIQSYTGARGCILKKGDGCVFTDSSDKTAYDYAGNLVYLAPGKQTICKYEKKEEGIAGGISDEGKLYYSCVTDQDYGVVRIYDKQTKKKIFDKKFNYYIEGVFIFEKQKVMLICRYDKNLNIKVEEVSI